MLAIGGESHLFITSIIKKGFKKKSIYLHILFLKTLFPRSVMAESFFKDTKMNKISVNRTI